MNSDHKISYMTCTVSPLSESSVPMKPFMSQNGVKQRSGTSRAVQWLRFCASTAGGAGSIPGRGTKIPHAAQHGQKIKKKNKQTNREQTEK